jgi:hypothetical protein
MIGSSSWKSNDVVHEVVIVGQIVALKLGSPGWHTPPGGEGFRSTPFPFSEKEPARAAAVTTKEGLISYSNNYSSLNYSNRQQRAEL